MSDEVYRIKPLEWVKESSPRGYSGEYEEWNARTPWMDFKVSTRAGDTWFAWYSAYKDGAYISHSIADSHESLGAAKAAAEEWYRTQLSSALSPVDDEGTVEAIRLRALVSEPEDGIERKVNKPATETLECGCEITRGWRCPIHGCP